MGISTFYSYRDNAMTLHSSRYTSESDYAGDVEVTLAEERKKEFFSIKNENESKENSKHIINPISDDEPASRVLKYLELIHSKCDKYTPDHGMEEKTSSEDYYDTQLPMNKFDDWLEKRSRNARSMSSENHSDINSNENFRFRRKLKKPLVHESSPNVKISVLDFSEKGPRRRVSFHTDVVTKVVSFHPVSNADKKNFFYTANEMQQFRMEYLWDLQRMDERDQLDAKASEVWDAIQYCGETVLRFLFPLH